MFVLIRYLLLLLLPISLFADIDINSIIHSKNNSYQVIKKLGAGSYGAVFEVIDSQGDHYAVKSYFDSVFYRESERCYLLSEKLDHPNILKVLDLAYEENIEENAQENYCVFELVAGVTLQEVSNLQPEDALVICQQWIDALEFAFSKQLLNIDLNEENMMLSGENHVTIIDLDSFIPAEKFPFYTPSIYFNRILAEMTLTLIQKTNLPRATKIQAQLEVKRVTLEYLEDVKEGIEKPFHEYIALLLETLYFHLHENVNETPFCITHK